jgi:hypothetical protein
MELWEVKIGVLTKWTEARREPMAAHGAFSSKHFHE